MITLVIGRDSVGKRTYVSKLVSELYSSNRIYVLDEIGELTDRLNKMGLNVTSNIKEAEVVVSDGIKKEINEDSHYFLIINGNELNEELLSKAKNVILFPIENCKQISELLDIPVEYLNSLKPYEPITII